MSVLDAKLLEVFIDDFYGYGNLEAPYWFIGMEEGGGDNLHEVQRRIVVWHERGKNLTEDLADYHTAIGVTKFFDEQPKLQSTWRKLIRVLHILEDKPVLNDALRQTQRSSFGRVDGSSCLLELLPLPSPSIGHWSYGEYMYLPYLKDRETYRQIVTPKRIARLRELVRRYDPRIVLFYGLGYREYWQAISEIAFEQESIGELDAFFGHNEDTFFVVTHHPTSRGIGNDYFDAIGKRMREHMP